jgi:hypothetical protein
MLITIYNGLSDLRINVTRVIIRNRSYICLIYIKRRGICSIYAYHRSIYILDKDFRRQEQLRYYI